MILRIRLIGLVVGPLCPPPFLVATLILICRLIYPFCCRYLDTYEKYYFLGEEEEDESNLYFDEEDSRARRQSRQKIVQNVPTTYNDNQHRIAGE